MSTEPQRGPGRPATQEWFDPPHLTFPGMSQAVRSGDLLSVSGQVALDENNQLVGVGDATVQVEQ